MIHGRFLVKARKLGVLVMTFIALAAILRASGVDDPCCDRTAAIIMQCSLVRQTCPDNGMVTLDAANAQRLTDAYICGVCAGYDGDESRLYSMATQCWLKNKSKWEKAKCATGQNKGYSCAKVLADAQKKSA